MTAAITNNDEDAGDDDNSVVDGNGNSGKLQLK